MTEFTQLAELTTDRNPDIWVVCATVEGANLSFELAYLNAFYGGSEAVLVPVGAESPRIRVTIPDGVINRPSSTILIKPTKFTILEIIY
jgi:hypothetical protein